MKSFLIRPALALALAAGLAGCGGSDKAEFTVGGTVYNLLYPGLKLTTNGTTIDVAPPSSMRSSPQRIWSALALPGVLISVWPRRPCRQSWRCS